MEAYSSIFVRPTETLFVLISERFRYPWHDFPNIASLDSTMATICLIPVKKYIEKRVLAGILPIRPHLRCGGARDTLTVSGSAGNLTSRTFSSAGPTSGIQCFRAD